jgi:hypothetical protein
LWQVERAHSTTTTQTIIKTTTTTTNTTTQITTTTTTESKKWMCPIPTCPEATGNGYGRKSSLNKHINKEHPDQKALYIDQTKITLKNQASSALNSYLHSLKLAIATGTIPNRLTAAEQQEDRKLIEDIKQIKEDLTEEDDMAKYLKTDEQNFSPIPPKDPKYVSYTHLHNPLVFLRTCAESLY